MSRCLTLIAAALLAGCGFHLQGDLSTPPEMARTYIDPVDRFSLFHRELRLQLQAAGVELVDSAEQATAILTISEDETGQRVLSVSARNVPTEFEVFYVVEYGITSSEGQILAPQFLSLTRDYTFDPTLVLGKEREESMMREAIVKDLVRIVLKQVSSI